MNKKDEQKLTQLLVGIDLNDINRRANIYWLQSSKSSVSELRDIKHLDDEVYVFGSTHEEDAQLLGSFGSDGDELVFNGTLIVETCAYSAFPYIDVTGPIYLTFESDADCELLRQDLFNLHANGELPEAFSHPAVAIELAAFDPGNATLNRFVVSDDTVTPLAVPDVVTRLQQETPHLCRYFQSAVIMAKRLQVPASDLRFDLPTNAQPSALSDLLFARQGEKYRCMNMRTGKIYQLGRDMYRAAISVVRPERYCDFEGLELDDQTKGWALEALESAVSS